ncbi:putative Mg2+ transporter-C (MgtC) family protein [Rhodoligotrophos appendicifer]|uniref:MgtC/SapB family protein n=1 Tax=Rhodoligotrophos appendicifer TaxID=987056 RepID=UPI001186F1C3|nr:MgtC/SapB family protein [Rhodoligotrophos appendicifer]
MDLFDLQWHRLLEDLVTVAVAFVLALPLGWHREGGKIRAGLRTFPVVAMAACGFALIARYDPTSSAETRARILQGIITGVGFIGGGAILKRGDNVQGVVTAASIWNTGAIGVAVAYARLEIAIVLSLINFVSLILLTPMIDDDTST